MFSFSLFNIDNLDSSINSEAKIVSLKIKCVKSKLIYKYVFF